MGFFRVEVVIPKDLNLIKRALVEAKKNGDQNLRNAMSEWKDEDNISRYKLEAALKKAFPHSKVGVRERLTHAKVQAYICMSARR